MFATIYTEVVDKLWQADRAEGVKAAAWDLFTAMFRPASDGAPAWTVPTITAEQMSGVLFVLEALIQGAQSMVPD